MKEIISDQMIEIMETTIDTMIGTMKEIKIEKEPDIKMIQKIIIDI